MPRMFMPLMIVASLLPVTVTATMRAQVTPYEDGWIEEALRALPEFESSVASRVLADPETFKLQILIAEVEAPESGPPRLVRHGLRVGAEYFYPASTIKLCAAIAAVQQAERLSASPGPNATPAMEFSLDTPLRFEPLSSDEPVRELDPTNIADGPAKGRITLGHEIRKLFIVSDNEAFNRLFDFVGRDALNTMMWDAGLASVRIRHRLSVARTEAQNAIAPEIVLARTESVVTRIPRRTSTLPIPPNRGSELLVGVAHMAGGQRVEAPLDFADKNEISLVHLQDCLVKLVRPDVRLTSPPFRLSDKHRDFLLEAMRQTPRESENPRYDPEAYPDDYTKFLLPGIRRVAGGDRLEIRGKIGLAYGFVTENSYVVDPETGRACFVTATIYTNSDGVLNDDAYDYDTIALPFMADLGEAVARRLLRTGGEPDLSR